MAPLTVPDSAAWYVRTGLARGITTTKAQIATARENLQKLDNVPESEITDDIRAMLIDQANSIIAYHEQWLREALDEYAKLPEELRPTNG